MTWQTIPHETVIRIWSFHYVHHLIEKQDILLLYLSFFLLFNKIPLLISK